MMHVFPKNILYLISQKKLLIVQNYQLFIMLYISLHKTNCSFQTNFHKIL